MYALDQIRYAGASRWSHTNSTAHFQLHFSEPSAYFDIYAQGSTVTKDPRLYAAFSLEGSIVTLLDPAKSRSRREMMHPFFSRRAVLNLENVIQTKVSLARIRAAINRRSIDLFFPGRQAYYESAVIFQQRKTHGHAPCFSKRYARYHHFLLLLSMLRYPRRPQFRRPYNDCCYGSDACCMDFEALSLANASPFPTNTALE